MPKKTAKKVDEKKKLLKETSQANATDKATESATAGSKIWADEPPKPAAKFDESNPYYHIINEIIDPEIGVGIADMGLIYDVKENDGALKVTMTLTSMGCPAGPQLTTDVDAILRLQSHVKDVEIEVVWEPMWTPDKMKPEIKDMLFGNM